MNTPTTTRLIAALLGLILLGTSCRRSDALQWKLTDIGGHFPDLEFNLASNRNPVLDAGSFRGKVVLLFFGYAHCPDICPVTMSRLATAVQQLGGAADDVRILFVSVDPQRDTPEILEHYAKAFSPEALGLTGSARTIEALAKRYRVAYQAEPPDSSGNYEVMHSKAVYVFDRQGHARLMISDTDPSEAIVHDLKQLIGASSKSG